jgi:hypothetical protein
MNEAREATGFTSTRRTKLSLIAVASLMLGSALVGYLCPQRPLPGFKKQPTQTPTRQEPSRRPNTSLEPELLCRFVVARPTRAT